MRMPVPMQETHAARRRFAHAMHARAPDAKAVLSMPAVRER